MFIFNDIYEVKTTFSSNLIMTSFGVMTVQHNTYFFIVALLSLEL